jgi:ABC-2 type transport system ATP-binding protein
MIEVRGATKRYESVMAVDGVSFEAKSGEIFGLIGPNGAGKSTTIRMIMNIIAPDSGEILFSGRPLGEADKDRIGYLPEERGIYKKVKVNEVLLYLASLKGVREKDAQPEIDRWLERFEIADWKGRKVEELSKGMAQKVQFVGSIAHKPELVFFDEPFSGLDPLSSETLLKAMVELRDEGRTVLFSTHIMEHAEKICNRIFLVNKGKEVVSGTLSEVKERFGRNSVIVEFDGDGGFIKALPFVSNVIEFPRWVEVELSGKDSSDELFKALAGRVSVRRFERATPSLHKIFMDLVGHGAEQGAEGAKGAKGAREGGNE